MSTTTADKRRPRDIKLENRPPAGHWPPYLVISPVRNEATYIELTLRSMTQQTVPPSEWIIVNDGSIDETAAIVARHARQYPWIKLVNRDRRATAGRTEGQDRQRGKGVIDTFYYGFERSSSDYQFVIKLDGDVSFEPEYFEFMLKQFSRDARLGIAGGSLYEQIHGQEWTLRTAPDHVRGPCKMYRRECFETIGGLERALGWDGIDEWRALKEGWQVCSFAEVRIFHHRPTGDATGKLKSKLEQGYGAHYMGYHPLYTIARGLRHMSMRPYVVGGMTLILGHLAAWLQGREQYHDRSVLQYVRRTQRRQLVGLLVGKQAYKN